MPSTCQTPTPDQPLPAAHWIDWTLPSPEENLAVDHVLLDMCEQSGDAQPAVRFWESPTPLVVLGRSSQWEQEVNLPQCQSAGVPVLRRLSGGATILAGPGCLMYAVAVSLRQNPELRAVDHAHARMLGVLTGELRSIDPSVRCAGTSDLVVDSESTLMKFSGNSVRLGRQSLLYHGTLLYDFDLDLIPRYLREPPRQPNYRERRPHDQFITNLPSSREALVAAICKAFKSNAPLPRPPQTNINQLVDSHYGQESWNLQR